MHAVLQYFTDALKSGSYPISYEINSWSDLESWFYRHIELQKRFDMTRSCPIGWVAASARVAVGAQGGAGRSTHLCIRAGAHFSSNSFRPFRSR
jgi:hypothetical protein